MKVRLETSGLKIPNLNFAQIGGFHMQGTSGRGYSVLCLDLNNAADGSLRFARMGEN